MHKVQTTPLVGLPQFDGWSQVVSTPDHSCVAAFAIYGHNASNVGRDIAEKIIQSQLSSATALHHLLTDITHQVRLTDCQLQLAVGLFLAGTSIFGVNRGQVTLKRGLKVGQLVTSTGELNIIEGKYTPEDIVILSTLQASMFGGEIQQKLSQGFDVDTIITSVIPSLHSADNSSLSALAFVTFGENVSTPSPQPIQISPSPVVPTAAVAIPLATTSISRLQSTSPNSATRLNKLGQSIKQLLTRSRGRWQPASRQSLANGNPLGGSFGNSFSLSTLGTHVAGLWPGSSEVYITRNSKKQVVRLLLPVLLLVLVVGVGVAIQRSRVNQQVEAATQAVAPWVAELSNAQNLVSSDPLAAREKVAVSIAELEKLEQGFAQQTYAQKTVTTQLTMAKQLFQDISGQEEFNELAIFHDLQLVQQDFVGNVAKSNGQYGAFLDTDRKQLILLNIQTKEPRRVNVSDMGTVVDVSLQEKNMWLLAGGIRRAPLVGTASATLVKPEDDVTKTAKYMAMFGQYVYVFSPEKRNIFRYVPQDETLSDAVGWLRSSLGVEFDQITSMAIDGDIWLTTNQGQIKKFTSGKEVDFEVKGLPTEFSSPIIMYTREDLTQLYVLEANKHRVVILNKSGEFIREIKSASLASATTLIAEENIKKVLAVSGSIIFEIPL